jgi:hypothetical protein
LTAGLLVTVSILALIIFAAVHVRSFGQLGTSPFTEPGRDFQARAPAGVATHPDVPMSGRCDPMRCCAGYP